MQIAWITDIHLNFISTNKIISFSQPLNQYDAVLITGDISESPEIVGHLDLLSSIINKPIYFVLGNHDFYQGKIETTRQNVSRMENDNLFYLNNYDIINLDKNTCLIGHDGWYDGRNGLYEASRVALNDFNLIKDFEGLDKQLLKYKLEKVTDEAAQHIEKNLKKAIEQGYQKIIVATHVPPYHEAAWYKGNPSNNDFAPFFSNKSVGLNINAVMRDNPNISCEVYCGHTHHPGTCYPLDNITVFTGSSGATDYGNPGIAKIIEI